MKEKAKWHPTMEEAIESAEIGTKEQAFLIKELETNEKSKETLQKAIEAIDWINPIIKKRIEEIEKE